MDLEHFDNTVAHDVDSGMIPMIQQAQELVKARGYALKMYGSPWSPPAWMKERVWGQQSMLLSNSPNGLMPSMQRPWAKYFSKFISAYRKHGIELWGVTVQNEPEAAVGWEACLWTPEYMASFVRDHLGPVLKADHPEVKIIGFDHNKDHVALWATGLYADPEAAKYFYGIGVHVRRLAQHASASPSPLSPPWLCASARIVT
jgi:glucosylceramidase